MLRVRGGVLERGMTLKAIAEECGAEIILYLHCGSGSTQVKMTPNYILCLNANPGFIIVL
jgi:hypothetical protein